MKISRITTKKQRRRIRDLLHLVAERHEGEVEVPAARRERDDAISRYSANEREQVTAKYHDTRTQVQTAYSDGKNAAAETFATDRAAALAAYQQLCKRVAEQSRETLVRGEHSWQEARFEATTVFEATKNAPRLEVESFQKQVDTRWQELQGVYSHALELLRRRRFSPAWSAGESGEAPFENRSPLERLAAAEATVCRQVELIEDNWSSRLLEGARPLGVFLLLWLVAVVPSVAIWSARGWQWIVFSAVVALLASVALYAGTYPIAKRHMREVFAALRRAKMEAEAARKAAIDAARAEGDRKYQAIVGQRDAALRKADLQWSKISSEAKEYEENQLAAAAAEHAARLEQIAETRDRQLEAIEGKYPTILEQLDGEVQAALARLAEQRDHDLAQSRQRFEMEWDLLKIRWTTGVSDLESSIEKMNQTCDELFLPWEKICGRQWSPPTDVPPAIRFGQYRLSLDWITHGVPEDEGLQIEQKEFDLPAVLSYPESPSLLMEAEGEGRERAVDALQNVMLRYLTSLPPGKVRFTIIDPTGLGGNFSAFMHLADFDERLVTSRIWSEASHINLRLAELTEHIEKVIQKYLRNEFESIQQYNEYAGEVAEPYHILVVANFPTNFSEEAARRLVSIASSGARCGVYTLISTDTRMALPRNFDLADLEARAATLQWRNGRFAWKNPDFEKLPLAMDAPPNEEQFTEAVRAVGDAAKDANRVRVPFAEVTAPGEKWWVGDSRAGIEVALGRAGANKLQTMRLGKGTSQHVLIAGKTGSGKSTLFNALITNMALSYSPDEVEFYLIDFKKGVEFKAYAAAGLPHARVIAIESEREFGLSVLERLDLELKRRGDIFREAGAQDLPSFRDAHPQQRVRRVLLVIDEFQELFVKDDRLAQNASLLLDRLVRQGRAFGIHVLLGSQTLGGAYSLARSTVGQMAVRIALQCSETDAHLILSEENTAARLLSRPGEAIYNDANGLIEGNHPFQVVWLPDHEREEYLQQLGALARERKVSVDPPIVFEGNVPADPSRNRLLRRAVSKEVGPEGAVAPQAWLGAAVAIKDPTAAVFRRQGGSNLLLVGQHPEAALGVLANCVVSLAAHHPLAGAKAPKFYVLDGTRPEANEAGAFQRIADALPLDANVVQTPKIADPLGSIAEVLRERMESDDESLAPIYLILYNLARFRSLKRAEDDFGFSSAREDKPASAAQQLREILREGPSFGLHTLVWCDTYNNVSRWLEREALRDFEMRLLFPMSATDSSNLIDSPAAGSLGVHRALFYSEDQGRLEKFQPYGSPTDEWLAWIREQFESRSLDASPAEPMEESLP